MLCAGIFSTCLKVVFGVEGGGNVNKTDGTKLSASVVNIASVFTSFFTLIILTLCKKMSSVSSSLLGDMGLDDATHEFLIGEINLLTPNAFLDVLPEVGAGDVDAVLNDGNDGVLDTAMAEFLGEIELNQRKQPVTKSTSKPESLLTAPPSNELNQRRQPVAKATSKLESLLTMPPPSNVRRNKRTFCEAVRSDQPSKKAKGNNGKCTKILPTLPSEPPHIVPNVVIEIEDELSPPTPGCRATPKKVISPTIVGNGVMYSPISVPDSEVLPPISAPVDITTHRPLSPIIGDGRRRRMAAKALRKQKGVNVEPASTSSSSSSQPGSSGLSVSGATVEPASATSSHLDWGGFSASQKDVFSRAFEKRCAVQTVLENECRTLEKSERELVELQQKVRDAQQKVRDAENRIEHSKTVIGRCKDNLLFLRKTFSDN